MKDISLPHVAPAFVPLPQDIPVPYFPRTECIQSHCCPTAESVSQSSFCSGHCSAVCAAASAERAWWFGGGHSWAEGQKSLGSKQAERGVGRPYDLASALLTLAQRQPHHWVERCTLARRWPIPKDVRRRGGGWWGRCWFQMPSWEMKKRRKCQ